MDVLANIIRVFANSTRPFADIIRVFVKSTRVFANLVCKHLTNTYNELQRVAIMASGLWRHKMKVVVVVVAARKKSRVLQVKYFYYR